MNKSIETKPIENDGSDYQKFQLNYNQPITPINPNKKEINIIFNQGMDDFLKNNKSVYDCPYKEEDMQRVEAWREGFKYAVEVFSEKFAEYCVREMIMKRQQIENPIVTPSLDLTSIH